MTGKKMSLQKTAVKCMLTSAQFTPVVLIEKHGVMTENKDASAVCFLHLLHTEEVKKWHDGESKYASVGQSSHFTLMSRAQSIHIVLWLAILTFLTMAFNLPVLETELSVNAFASAPSLNAEAIAPTSSSIMISLFLSFL